MTHRISALLLILGLTVVCSPKSLLASCGDAPAPTLAQCPFFSPWRAEACVIDTICVGEGTAGAISGHFVFTQDPSVTAPGYYTVSPAVAEQYGPLEVTVQFFSGVCSIYGGAFVYEPITLEISVEVPEEPEHCGTCHPDEAEWYCDLFDPPDNPLVPLPYGPGFTFNESTGSWAFNNQHYFVHTADGRSLGVGQFGSEVIDLEFGADLYMRPFSNLVAGWSQTQIRFEPGDYLQCVSLNNHFPCGGASCRMA